MSDNGFPYNVDLKITHTPDGAAIIEWVQDEKRSRIVLRPGESLTFEIRSVRDIIIAERPWPESSLMYDGSLVVPPRLASRVPERSSRP